MQSSERTQAPRVDVQLTQICQNFHCIERQARSNHAE